jgi:hypothetical protein
MSSIIDAPSSDDDIPGPSGLKIVAAAGRKRSAPTPAAPSNDCPPAFRGLNNHQHSKYALGSTTSGGVNSGTAIPAVSPPPVAGALNNASTGRQKGSTVAAGNKTKAKVVTATSTTSTTTKTPRPSKAFCLIWVCTHGKGRRRSSWRNKDLKIMGVYPTKADAENAKRHIMSQYECCGHGDILVGGTWEDEIDLVIREAPLNL